MDIMAMANVTLRLFSRLQRGPSCCTLKLPGETGGRMPFNGVHWVEKSPWRFPRPACLKTPFDRSLMKQTFLPPWKFISSPLKIYRAAKGKDRLPAIIFQGGYVLNFGRVILIILDNPKPGRNVAIHFSFRHSFPWDLDMTPSLLLLVMFFCRPFLGKLLDSQRSL